MTELYISDSELLNLVQKLSTKKIKKLTGQELVEIQEIPTDQETVYIVSIAGINLRAYLSEQEAEQISFFMKQIVDILLTTDIGIEIQELKTPTIPIYLLKIGGISTRPYLSKDEMQRTIDYMTKIVDAVRQAK